MSFEMYFLIFCGTVLLGAIALLTVSTVVMGSKHLLRLQYMFSSLKFNSEVEKRLVVTLDKVDAGLLIARLEPNGKTIHLYTPSEMEDRLTGIDAYNRGDRWSKTETHGIELWVGNKYTQYGYIAKFYDKSQREFCDYCGSYKTFRRIMALEEELRNPTKPEPVKPEKPKKEKQEDIELQ